MARFRKGTTDHDGDGAKGGSLKAGSRFVPGTNDADNDGRKGGSLPKGDAPMAKKATTRRAAPKADDTVRKSRRAVTTPGDKAPEAQPTLAKRKEAAEEQFSAADETAAADARLRLAVRGF